MFLPAEVTGTATKTRCSSAYPGSDEECSFAGFCARERAVQESQEQRERQIRDSEVAA